MSSLLIRFLCTIVLSFCMFASAVAQDLTALARLDGAKSGARAEGDSVRVELALTQAVPYRVFTLDEPQRVVLDFREVDWQGLQADAFAAPGIAEVNAGAFRPGWSRLVLMLDAPMSVEEAGMQTDPAEGSALVSLTLHPTTAEQFAAMAGAPDSALLSLPDIAETAAPIQRQAGDRPLIVVLDPGHGGIDPGAEHGELYEAQLMLDFARELKEALIRTGQFEVVLTREEDIFVPLETRVSIARAARADVFLSLHADALSEGQATGATVYTLSDTASDRASALLAERHDRADLLAGVDLSDQDDEIAVTLMELARLDTSPRSARLADTLVEGIRESGARLYKRPRLTAGFSVLKAPDIPSVLIELGFLSSPRDLEDLLSDEWRDKVAAGIVSALQDWAAADAAEARLIRQ